MNIAPLCLVFAAVFGIAGTALGSGMGIVGDFRLAHAHSHINLLGWVTLSLYGLYHRGVARPTHRLAWLQVSCALAGTPLMTVGLTAYLASGRETKPFIVVAVLSSILIVASAVMFLIVVVLDALAGRLAPAGGAARPIP